MPHDHCCQSRRPGPATLLLVAVLLVVAAAGGATAGAMITGRQIKNGTVTGKDVKDASLRLADVAPADRRRLRGATGETGAQGPGAFEPPPSGQLVTGGGIYVDVPTAAGQTFRTFVDLPFTLDADLSDSGVNRNVWGAPGDNPFPPSSQNMTVCPGTSALPDATAGNVCIYPSFAANVTPNSGTMFAGISVNVDGRRIGFLVGGTSVAAGTLTNFRFTWAYRAP